MSDKPPVPLRRAADGTSPFDLNEGEWVWWRIANRPLPHFAFRLPGHPEFASIPVRDHGTPAQDRVWDFDGNMDAPTLTPSIKQIGGDGREVCHGHIIEGEWRPV